MSKKQRGFQAPSSGAQGADPTPPAGSGPSAPAGSQPGSAPRPPATGSPGSGPNPPRQPGSGGTRAAARRRSAPVKVGTEPTGFLERYRFLLLLGAIVIGVGAVGLVLMQSATAAPYTCATLLTPRPVEPVPTPRPAAPTAPPAATPGPSAAPGTPAPSTPSPTATPEPQPTQRLGFVAQDLGRDHGSQGETISYAYCPPTSGKHYNIQNLAPLRRAFYDPGDKLTPGNWIHNLEHGYVVLLYKGDPGKAVLDQLEQVMASAEDGALSEACGLPNKVIAVRFDDLSEPFAAVSWDRAFLLSQFDADQLRTFAEQWQDSPVSPEQAC